GGLVGDSGGGGGSGYADGSGVQSVRRGGGYAALKNVSKTKVEPWRKIKPQELIFQSQAGEHRFMDSDGQGNNILIIATDDDPGMRSNLAVKPNIVTAVEGQYGPPCRSGKVQNFSVTHPLLPCFLNSEHIVAKQS